MSSDHVDEQGGDTESDPDENSIRGVVRNASSRIQGIVQAAEEAAAKIKSAARTEADEYVRTRKAEVESALSAPAEKTRREAAELAGIARSLLDEVADLKQSIDGNLESLTKRVEAVETNAQELAESTVLPVASETLKTDDEGSEEASTSAADEDEEAESGLDTNGFASAAPTTSESAGGAPDQGPLADRGKGRGFGWLSRKGTEEPGSTPSPTPEAEPAGPVKASAASGEVPSPKPSPGGRGDDAARLLATQMAIAGSDRAEIEERLQSEFRLINARVVVDEILGKS